ncbi:MAG: murein biosynthesis integral membrane protein MurJ [Firmicutes bacterium]|nr:murein biosynthesis integral membrane protein MurJ [Bacillota bacterium]
MSDIQNENTANNEVNADLIEKTAETKPKAKTKIKEDSVARSAIVVMLASLVSRFLGYFRDVIIYAQIGQNNFTDAYNAAFKIPDAIYTFLVGGALAAAFIPVISSYIAKGEKDEVWRFTSVVINVIAVMLLILTTFAYIFAPQLVGIYVSGFDQPTMDLTIVLTRIMLLQAILMALAGICQGILQSFKVFTPTAVGSVFYNIGIIAVGAAFSGIIEHHFPGYGITAFSIGVVAGALGNFLIQAQALRKVGMRYHFTLDVRNDGFKKMVGLMLPVLLSLGATQINLFVNVGIASTLESGLLSALNTAQRLMQLPITIFAVSIAMAVFPTLSREAASNDLNGFRKDFSYGIRSILFLMIPFSALLVVLGVPFIRFFFEVGKFTAENTANVAFALYFYSIGIFAYGCIQILNRAFYAFQDTKRPVIVAVTGVAINLLLSFTLVKYMQHGGLALAYSTAGVCNVIFLLVLLRKKMGHIGLKEISVSVGKTLIATAVLILAAGGFSVGSEMLLGISSKITQMIQLCGGGILGLIAFFITAKLLKMSEVESVLNTMKRKFGRGKKKQ